MTDEEALSAAISRLSRGDVAHGCTPCPAALAGALGDWLVGVESEHLIERGHVGGEPVRVARAVLEWLL